MGLKIAKLISQDTNVNLESEFNNAKNWSEENEIFIDKSKTTELIIFYTAFAKNNYINEIPSISCIQAVEETNFLGVTICQICLV